MYDISHYIFVWIVLLVFNRVWLLLITVMYICRWYYHDCFSFRMWWLICTPHVVCLSVPFTFMASGISCYYCGLHFYVGTSVGFGKRATLLECTTRRIEQSACWCAFTPLVFIWCVWIDPQTGLLWEVKNSGLCFLLQYELSQHPTAVTVR